MPISRAGRCAGYVGLAALLTAPGCSPVPETAAVAESPLENTVWILAELDGGPVAVPPSRRLPDLRFREGERVTGFTGCGILTGTYEATDTRLDFREPLVTTRGLCPSPETTLQQQTLLDVLRRATRYEISGKPADPKRPRSTGRSLLHRFSPG